MWTLLWEVLASTSRRLQAQYIILFAICREAVKAAGLPAFARQIVPDTFILPPRIWQTEDTDATEVTATYPRRLSLARAFHLGWPVQSDPSLLRPSANLWNRFVLRGETWTNANGNIVGREMDQCDFFFFVFYFTEILRSFKGDIFPIFDSLSCVE